MKQYYRADIRHMKELEDGFLKEVTDQYILDAVSFTDAETIAYKFAEEQVQGEFTIKDVKKTTISEIVNPDKDYFWNVRIQYSTVDGDKAKEVVIKSLLLVGGDDVKEVTQAVEEHLNTMLVPYKITGMSEQPKIQEIIEGSQYA